MSDGKEMLYEVPLDDDRTAQLWLPRNLTQKDAERMEAFFAALVLTTHHTEAKP